MQIFGLVIIGSRDVEEFNGNKMGQFLWDVSTSIQIIVVKFLQRAELQPHEIQLKRYVCLRDQTCNYYTNYIQVTQVHKYSQEKEDPIL